MKKLFSFLLGFVALATAVHASANGEVISAMNSLVSEMQAKPASKQNAGEQCNFILEPQQPLKLQVLADTKLTKPVSSLKKVRSTSPAKLTAADIAGYYVGTYNTLASGSFDGGSSMQIVRDATGDSITINYFWNGKSVRAFVDASANTVRIPRQQIMVDENLGQLDIAVASYPSGAPDYAAEIVGEISGNSIDFSKNLWAIYVQTGTNKDKFIGAYGSLVLEVPSGTMEYTRGTSKYGYYVVLNQTSDNLLQVKNIFNWGLSNEILLTRDRTAVISNQIVAYSSNGPGTLIKCLEFNEAGNLTKYSPIVTTDVAAPDSNTVLSWTDWSILLPQVGQYMGRLENAKLTSFQPFKYPALSVSGFEGSGTETDPYQLSVRDHFILLSDLVKASEEIHGEYFKAPVVSAFYGKHFAITQDIDFMDYRLDPIGVDYYNRFGGIVDGRGHTLKNVSVDGGSASMGGLFGVCDTISSIKNLNIENVTANADYYYAGGVAGLNYGAFENINVTNPTITSTRMVAGALGGIVYGPIKNCKVTGGTVTSMAWLGGMVGESHGAMTDCDVEGTTIYMTGSGSCAGGVVGNLLADGDRLSFAGKLSYLSNGDQQFLGGVAGLLQSCTLRNSYAGGQVIGYSNESYVGGLVGYCKGNVENCYSSGLVHCYSRKAGGLIGVLDKSVSIEEPAVRNCYTSATTEVETYQYNRDNFNEVIGYVTPGVNVTLENLYADRNLTNFYSKRFGSNTAELTSAQGPQGFPAENWIFELGKYPRVKGTETRETANFTASAINFADGSNVKLVKKNTVLSALGKTQYALKVGSSLNAKGYYSEVKDNKMLEIATEFGNDTIFAVNGKMQTYHVLAVAPIPFDGDGSQEDPFLIKTKEDLITLSKATTEKLQNFPDLYFKMTNDIDLELSEEFVGINAAGSVASNQFSGVFDGNGHTVHRMTITGCFTWTKPRSEGQQGTINTSGTRGITGFIGRLGENGVVKNLTIAADSKLEMWAQCAAIVGSSNGLIENCRNYADVLGYSCWVGGIVGQMNKGSITRNCYNAGHIISCYANVGGIAGAVTTATIENCVNTGDIELLDYVTNFNTQRQRGGGIAGGTTSGGTYLNCVNYGTVYAMLNNAGGLVAGLEESGTYTAVMQNSFNFGNVYCGNKATLGAIAGLANSKNVSNVYFDVQNIGLKAGQNAVMTGVVPATTAFLTSGKAIEGFDTELWDFTVGKYPALKMFASEEKVEAARKVYLTMPEDLTVANLLGTATLSPDATWSLDKDDVFKIEGNKLVGPATIDRVVTANLTAVNKAGVSRRIELSAKPVLALLGSGTKEKPYLVDNESDWKELCTYIDNVADNLEGQYVSITADLDFNGTVPDRLGANGITNFGGILDGGNHVFRGVNLTAKAAKNCALIGTVAEGAVVKNFIFEGSAVGASTYSYIAPVVDHLYGTIENVESTAQVTNAKAYTSGVVAQAYNGAVLNKVKFSGSIESAQTYVGGVLCFSQAAGHITMTDCSFTGKIKSTYTTTSTSGAELYLGGLAASIGSADITNCFSDGEIELANTELVKTVAGLVGYASGNANFKEYTFTNCYNKTNITAGGNVAGLLAKVGTAANCKFAFTDCYNAGDISAKSTKALSSCPTAGIATIYTPGTTFLRCRNEGTIIADKNVYAAGITGNYSGTAGSTATPDSVFIRDCYNEGLIVADGNQGAGIVAYANGATIVENCYNTADIEAGQMAAGIVCGMAGTGPQIINCHNTGNVTTKFGRAAGIVSWGGPTNGVVKNCWNAGNVSSTATAGGSSAANTGWAIGGVGGYSTCKFENCYNVGTVTGMARVGGILGEPGKDKTQILNCYNAGKITAPTDSCGGIIGVNPIDNGKAWTANNKVENSYYLNDFAGTHTPVEGSKAVGVAELAGMQIPGFKLVDEYSFPVVEGYEAHKTAVFHAAQVVPAEGDTYANITKDFKVGGASHLTWTSTCPNLVFSGNDAKFSAPYVGEFTVTASNGDLSKTFKLVGSDGSGVDGVDAAAILSVRYFTTSGVEVSVADVDASEVYITVTTYADGTVRTAKVANVK